jgi:hypothetical protein
MTDPNNLEGTRTPEELAENFRELDRIAPTPADKFALMLGQLQPPLIPSLERGCIGKAKLGRHYQKEADKLSRKWGKRYMVYRCPHCSNAHLTTKIRKRFVYMTEILYITPKP